MAGLTAPVAATVQNSEQDWGRCRGDSPDAVIAGCTAVIGASGLTEQERAEALSLRAFAYRSRRDYPHAIADYEEALRRNPGAIWAHSGLAKVYGASGDYRRAIGEYDVALSLAENELALAR